MTDPTSIVKDKARELGFEAVGVCELHPIERDALAAWLENGQGGTMRYMHRQSRKRKHPSEIVSGATHAVMVLKNYRSEIPSNVDEGSARIASYAQFEDYHRLLRADLHHLRDTLLQLGADSKTTRAFVDAGPVPERELAQRAGLGWIAKNTMLIHPKLGSFTFIGSVFTDLSLIPDAPFVFDRCGACRRCLDACPTEAFPESRVLDATECISYLTIEYRGDFTGPQQDKLGEWLFGCDVCQDVCPWNHKFAVPTDDPRFQARSELLCPDLGTLGAIRDTEFNAIFGDTPLERAGPGGLRRNAAAVAENLSRTTRNAL